MVETETIRIEVPVRLGVKDTLGGLTVVVSVEEEKSATEPENPFLLARSISARGETDACLVERDIQKIGRCGEGDIAIEASLARQ